MSPRRNLLHITRVLYVVGLFGLTLTAWLVLIGTQEVRNIGDFARFGAFVFQFLAIVQLTLGIFFSALLTAAAVSQEKDRRTLILLLLTNLTNSELVLGKLLAAMLNVLSLLAAALPFFMLTALFGGVSFDQIARVFAVTLLSMLAAGSLGSMIALWREKTFQTLAMTTLLLVFWLIVWEIISALGGSDSIYATLATVFSPMQAVIAATLPSMATDSTLGWLGNPIHGFLLFALSVTVLLNVTSILMVRVWNPSRDLRKQTSEKEQQESIWGAEYDVASKGAAPSSPAEPAKPSVHAAPGKTRAVWDNPILWREICTWAYGRKVLLIRVAYVFLFALAAVSMVTLVQSDESVGSGRGVTLSAADMSMVVLLLLSLVLVNALSVTSITTERDSKALDLLLVTDITPKEFIFGKLGGVFYNTKEMVVLPMLLCIYLWFSGYLGGENLIFLLGGLIVINAFVAMLGIHVGMAYENSRNAIIISLGTLFFLFLGTATCMWIMISFKGSFGVQSQAFFAFNLGGGVGLYVALGSRNPSRAIGTASFLCPFATFYAITSFLLDLPLAVFLVSSLTYGFATLAMLIPAIFEFDMATGRTTEG